MTVVLPAREERWRHTHTDVRAPPRTREEEEVRPPAEVIALEGVVMATGGGDGDE